MLYILLRASLRKTGLRSFMQNITMKYSKNFKAKTIPTIPTSPMAIKLLRKYIPKSISIGIYPFKFILQIK